MPECRLQSGEVAGGGREGGVVRLSGRGLHSRSCESHYRIKTQRVPLKKNNLARTHAGAGSSTGRAHLVAENARARDKGVCLLEYRSGWAGTTGGVGGA